MKFDHVIHFIEDTPEQAVEFWEQQNLNAVIGGSHEKWGTRNALLYGKNSYIEWLAVEHKQIAESADYPLTQLLLHNGPGFGTVCLRVDSIADLHSRLTDLGYQTSGVLDGSRVNTEGKLIEWKMLFINEEPSARLPNPFFIQWNEPDEERFKGLRSAGVMTPDSENLEVERCVFGVEDVEEASDRWKELLDGNLQLPNCLIEFRKLEGKQERLEEVHYKNAERPVVYEQGLYVMK